MISMLQNLGIEKTLRTIDLRTDLSCSLIIYSRVNFTKNHKIKLKASFRVLRKVHQSWTSCPSQRVIFGLQTQYAHLIPYLSLSQVAHSASGFSKSRFLTSTSNNLVTSIWSPCGFAKPRLGKRELTLLTKIKMHFSSLKTHFCSTST
jgi:hypothetical protein